jgi:hypothetical protein
LAIEAGVPDEDGLQWLLAQGVTISALSAPWAVRATVAIFSAPGRYTAALIGEPAFVFAMLDRGIVDLAAWAPATGQIGARLGRGWAIGQGQLGTDGIGITGAPLPIFRTPLGWLKNHRRGIVIIDWDYAGFALSRVAIRPEDSSHCRELNGRLSVPPPIFVEPQRQAA